METAERYVYLEIGIHKISFIPKKYMEMKKVYFLLVVGAIIIAGCASDINTSDNSSFEAFSDSLFQTNVDSAYIAGASVIVYQKGEGLLNRSYGYANLELAVPMPGNASFEIGSVTKQFTSAAILKLVEEGSLALDDDVTQYLEFDTKGRSITISSLLNHTSGIPSYTELPEFGNIFSRSYDRDTLLRLVEQNDFLFEPGEALIYNNSAYFFLGLIIEEITEMSYEDYLMEQFFIPLGMHNTYYSSISKVISNKAYGYDYSENILNQKQFIDHTWPYSAGSLSSTAEDLLIWMRALHEGKVFNEKFYDILTNPRQLNNGIKVRYAMGLVNYMNFGHKEIGHGGGIPGFLSETKYLPDEDLFIICLINTMGPKGANYFAEELLWKLLDKHEFDHVEVDLDLYALAGIYTGQSRGQATSIEVNAQSNSITISTVGQSKVDTLKIYLGDSTWSDGNSLVKIKNDEYLRDDIYGYIKLKKE